MDMLPEKDFFRWRLIDLPVVKNWIAPSGRVVILGDAAHSSLPYLAAGASMAIEDACVMGIVIRYVTEKSQIPSFLRIFQNIRMPRAHTVQKGSLTNRSFIHMGDGPAQELRDQLLREGNYPASPNLMGNDLFMQWLYGFNVSKEATDFMEIVTKGSQRPYLNGISR